MFRQFLAILALSLFTFGTAFAQITSGDIQGTVKDATGAVIPNANIIITNEGTSVSTTVTANSNGEFHASNLPAGMYDLSVTSAGFQSYKLKGLEIDTNKTATTNIILGVAATQSVEVTAEAGVVLDTTTTNLTTTFDTEELASLPTSAVGLGVLNTSLLSPGVASTGGIGIGVGPSVGGQRPRNNNFTIEGIDNNNKAVTGPLVYVPNDAVGNFTLITNQFSPEFGHSSGGQFNTTVISGTNHFHGSLYEYFQNRDLNAASGIAGGKVPVPRYDNNRYGGQLGGPVFKDKLFFFGNFERNTIGQSQTYYLCTPTAAGFSQLNTYAAGFSATNLQQYAKYVPAANFQGGANVDASADNACFNQASGPQFLTVTDPNGHSQNVPLGNYLVSTPTFSNFDALTTSMDWNISSKDSIRGRYIYNTQGAEDTAANLPVFFTSQPFKFHLVALSEYHTFTPNVTNEFRLGFNRYDNTTGSGNFTFPGLDQFPNLTFYDQGFINVGPDPNAPQFTIQNLYQATDNISWIKGKHSLKFGFDGRKYISPQGFTQRARGDYEWAFLDQYLHDLAPDVNGFAQRSTGQQTYYGDQSALYFYGNDTWRLTPTVTLNVGLRYEFTSVPVGERTQQLNVAASVPGLASFTAPQPTYTSFAPRFGVNWAPDSKTSVRAGFGIAYDVLFDNLGTLSFPPQYSSTNNVNDPGQPAYSSPNFLKDGGLPPGTGSGITVFPNTPAGLAQQRAATAAYLPNQVTPYAETYTLTVQRTIGSAYTAELGYVGTRGIHLATQDQINVQPKVTATNQLGTVVNGSNLLTTPGSGATTLAAIADNPAVTRIVPAWGNAGFTGTITSYQPWSSSNYNGLVANLTRRFQQGLQMNLSYTLSKTMDDATAEVFATVLTPRRPQNSQCVACDYSRSALDRTHRISLEALWDLPYYKHSNSFLMRNVVGNWKIAPIYTYESPEYATTLSGVNSNLNGDSGAAIDRPLINPNGVKGTATGTVPVLNAVQCDPNATSGALAITGTGLAGGSTAPSCDANTVGYSAGAFNSGGTFVPSNAYYVQAGNGTLPTASRNSLPIRPINNIDLSAFKSLTVREHYSFEFGAQAYNVLNHAQYIPGTIDNVNATSYTASYNFQTVTSAAFNQPQKVFTNNARTMQLSAKIVF
jgi:hypothetical protein